MNPTDPEPNAFDALLDQLLKGEPVDADRFLETHPELSQDERRQVRFLTGGSAPREDGEALEAAAETGVQGMPRVGGFRLLRRIGAGGMGAVYLAEEAGLGRQVAVKILGPDLIGTGERAERFLREARAIARLRHPNIVTVHAAGEADGLQYMAMEYIPGASLQEVLALAAARGERPKVREVLRFGVEIARALACAHEAGIVHRDVKPSNIRISDDRRAMLLDFGLAHETGSVTLTEPGAFRGSPRYASPEQVGIRGVPVDARTDIYSLGATLYEALTGAALFRGETREQLFHQILESEPVRPRRLEPALSRDLETVLLAALEKDPARRHPSASALAGDLESLLAGRAVSVRPVSPAGRLLRWARRTPAKAAVAVLVILGLPLVAGLGGYILANQGRIDTAVAVEEAQRLDELLERAFLELGENDPRQAESLFREARHRDPASDVARAGLVLVRLALGDSEGTLALLGDDATDGDERGWRAHLRARAQQASDGRSADAGDLAKALAGPVTPVDHFVAGQVELMRFHRGRKPSAEAAYHHHLQAVLGTRSPKALYHHELGHAALHAGRHAEAREIAGAILRLWPDAPATLVAAGRTLFDADREQAVALFEKAVRQGPRTLHTRDYVARYLCWAGRVDLAVEICRETVAREPERAFSRQTLGEALIVKGDLDGAIRELRECVRLAPGSVGGQMFLARALTLKGEHAGGCAAGREAVRLAPDHFDPRLFFGVALLRAGDLDGAAEEFRTALRITPDDPQALCNLGGVLERLGRFRESLQALRAGHEIGSRVPHWRYPSADWVQATERLVALEERLEDIRRGDGPAPKPEENVRMAEEVCRPKKLYGEAARLYAAALPAEAALGSAPAGHLVNAAAFAVRAGLGEGADAPADDDGRAVLRQQAWKWFDAYLAGHERRLERGAARGPTVRKALACWTADPRVARLRDPGVLAGLPGSESAAWRALWDRLDAVLERLADE